MIEYHKELCVVFKVHLARWLSWLERRPVTAEVEGSSPFRVVFLFNFGIIAQLGEHLPYKQGVTGSSPIGPIYLLYRLNAAVAELADAQDLKSCGTYTPVPVRFRFAAFREMLEAFLYFFIQKNMI